MQAVSDRLERPTVHDEAQPRKGLKAQMEAFLTWFELSHNDTCLAPLLCAGIAHLWFGTLHAFGDRHDRLTQSRIDLAATQRKQQAVRFYALSASIVDNRASQSTLWASAPKCRTVHRTGQGIKLPSRWPQKGFRSRHYRCPISGHSPSLQDHCNPSIEGPTKKSGLVCLPGGQRTRYQFHQPAAHFPP